jgi:hypothetical protein
VVAPVVSVVRSAELEERIAPIHASAELESPPALRRRLAEAFYTKSAALLLGLRYGARLPSGLYAKREFLVVRLRPWWSRAGIKIVAYFGIPARARAGARAGVPK